MMNSRHLIPWMTSLFLRMNIDVREYVIGGTSILGVESVKYLAHISGIRRILETYASAAM